MMYNKAITKKKKKMMMMIVSNIYLFNLFFLCYILKR